MKAHYLLLLTAVLLLGCKRETAAENEDTTARDSAIENTAIDTTNMQTPADNDTEAGRRMMHAMKEMQMNMRNMKKTGNSDHDLAQAMKIHHQGGIALMEILFDNNPGEQLRDNVEKMRKKHEQEIETLNSIISSSNSAADYDPKNISEGLAKEMNQQLMETVKMPHVMDQSAERQFAGIMEKHHRIGIDMANTMMKHAKNAKLKDMASHMIKDMENEIRMLEPWVAAH